MGSMARNRRPFQLLGALFAISVALGLIGGVPFLLWIAVRALVEWISTQESQVAAAVVAAAGTVLAGLGAVILAQQRSKTREIAESHRPNKVELYTRFIKKVMDYMWKTRDRKAAAPATNDPELQEFFEHFTTDLVLWGSPGVIRAYGKFRRATKDESGLRAVLVMDELMRAMRKDLGHSDWLLQRGEVIKIFLLDPEELDKVRR